MNSKEAVVSYQFAERSKAELIIASRMLAALHDFKGAERYGAEKILSLTMGAYSSDLAFALKATSAQDFQTAIEHLGEAISLLENGEPEKATAKVAEAVTATVNVAQEALQVLSEHELI